MQDGAPKDSGLARRALEKVAALVDGNGMSAGDVTLVSAEEESFEFPAALDIELVPKIAERRINGKAGGDVSTHAGSTQELRQMIDNSCQTALADERLRNSLVQKITASPGEGWGQDGMKFALGDIRREFCFSEPCNACKGSSRMPCRGCSGQGAMPCPQCYREGRIHCLHCKGAGQIVQPDGTRQGCGFCRGIGYTVCTRCTGQKMIPCSVCNGTQSEGCTDCGQTGWQSLVCDVHFDAQTRFVTNMDLLNEDQRAAVEKIGLRALAQGHAEIHRAREDESKKEEELQLRYRAVLPFAHVQFRLQGKNLRAQICGFKAEIVKMPPFLDTLLTPGYEALKRGGSGISAHLTIAKACQYRLLRELLLDVSGHFEKTVARDLYERCRPALSPKMARALVHQAKLALRASTRATRYMGLLLGAVIAVAIFYVWFSEGLRHAAMQMMPNAQLAMLVDFSVLLLGYVAALYTIKLWAARALRKALTPALEKITRPQARKKTSLPDAGMAGLWALLVCVLLFAGLGAISPQPPFWIREVLMLF